MHDYRKSSANTASVEKMVNETNGIDDERQTFKIGPRWFVPSLLSA